MSLRLPARSGPRPTTRRTLPHSQLDQTPSPETYHTLLKQFLALPNTTSGKSFVSVPGSVALHLCEGLPCNHQAFFGGREFAHIHPATDGSFHMILSEADCAEVLQQGWGELHPYAESGRIQKTAIMIYAPRDEQEIACVLSIARASLAYASQPASV